MTITSEGGQRLADWVEREMRQRGLTARRITSLGGPSGPTTAAILRGEGARLDSLAKLDAALDWVQGSSVQILNGGHPERLDKHEISIDEALAAATPEQFLRELGKRLGVPTHESM